MAKRYYWLRLKRDFFKRHDIKVIESMPNGKDYILFYLKLLCESVDHDGNLRFSDIIPYSVEMLSAVTDTNIDVVRSAMKIFTDLHMIDVLDDETIFMTEVQGMIGSAVQDEHTRESTRLRVQKCREKKKTLTLQTQEDCYSNITCNGELELEIEKEIDINTKEIDKEKSDKKTKHKYGKYKNVLLSDDDISKLQNEFPYDWEKRIENLSEAIEVHGYKYKNHLATIRAWARKDTGRNNSYGGQRKTKAQELDDLYSMDREFGNS